MLTTAKTTKKWRPKQNKYPIQFYILSPSLNFLAHNISGHGPFSHLWEGFVNKANPGLNWAHEDSSIRMLDYLIQDNNLMPILAALGGLNAQVSFSQFRFSVNVLPVWVFLTMIVDKSFINNYKSNPAGLNLEFEMSVLSDLGGRLDVFFLPEVKA